jgi:hypothetical protein
MFMQAAPQEDLPHGICFAALHGAPDGYLRVSVKNGVDIGLEANEWRRSPSGAPSGEGAVAQEATINGQHQKNSFYPLRG